MFRRVLGSEGIAFADTPDMAYNIKYDVQLMTNAYILMSVMMDSLSLFNILTKASTTTKTRLKVDLESVQNVYKNGEIQDVTCSQSEYNIADAVTKTKKQIILVETFKQARSDDSIQRKIIRPSKTDSIVRSGEC